MVVFIWWGGGLEPPYHEEYITKKGMIPTYFVDGRFHIHVQLQSNHFRNNNRDENYN